MTAAELLLLVAGATGIYFILRPLQRWLERCLRRWVFARRPRLRPPTIDVVDFTSGKSHSQEDDHS
jgi:hypothetical protein